MKIQVDRDKCTALGLCESLAPHHFEINDEGELVVLDEDVSEADLDEVQEACNGCPTEALQLVNVADRVTVNEPH